MKALFGLLIFFAGISTMEAQTPTAPGICITKMCTGVYANKSEILDLKRILVLYDTLTIKTFTLGANTSCYWEANCVGNTYSSLALDMLERISSPCKLFLRVNFLSKSGREYGFDYVFNVKAK